MPRPPVKRRRSNSQRPTSPKRAPSNAGLSNTPRVKLQQQLAKKPLGQKPQDSDDSDRLVTRTRHGRGRRTPEQIFASGGVAKGDKPGVFPTKQERRQKLRSDTEEIVRRSRSKSIEASKEKLSKSRSTSLSNSRVDGPSSIANDKPLATTSPKTMVPASQPTPMAETSILSALKPRKRQPSILHMIDNNDSSTINPEDEEQFLPDDESTPVNTRKSGVAQSFERLAADVLSSASRKRKLGSDEPEIPADRSTPASSIVRVEATPEDPISLPSTSPKHQSIPADDDDDIMALPQSSSPESSPKKPRSTENQHKKTASVPTTEQLQSMMPSKRHKTNRQRKPVNEFDIPEDSNSDDANGVEESAFIPNKRVTKSRNRKESTITKAKPKEDAATKTKKVSAGTPVSKSKQTTKSTSTPLKVVTPRTPLPLTRNANQENKTMSVTRERSRNSKLNGANKGINATVSKTGTEKQSGGSRPRRGLRNIITTGAESDKENEGSTRITRSSRKRVSPSEPTKAVVADINDAQPSIEAPDETSEDMEVEDHIRDTPTNVDEDDTPATETTTTPKLSGTTEIKAWKNKWANIDDWSLDYEEVSISTGSSSPMRVSVA